MATIVPGKRGLRGRDPAHPGATVVPHYGCLIRVFPPFVDRVVDPDHSGQYPFSNRNKQTITVDLKHPLGVGAYPLDRGPVLWSDTPIDLRRASLFGEQTEAILCDLLGYGGEEIAGLIADEAV